jgi:hypothetical protein
MVPAGPMPEADAAIRATLFPESPGSDGALSSSGSSWRRESSRPAAADSVSGAKMLRRGNARGNGPLSLW